ncbi:MAG: hypothetical protein J6S67_01865, partial [Methanobrevibacter sp.]|nr:hypothetical protein [Methanobrevibacter sp.]
MHLKCCEHPKRIRNPYLNKDVVVPCGKCNSCLQNKAMRYISAIRRERACWKYCLFVTLTYDNFNVPVLSRNGDCFFPKDIKHINPEQDNIFIDVNDLENNERDLKFISKQPYLLCLSPYDLQKFIKRYRSNLERYCAKNGYDKNKSAKVRYFGVGEYGETLYRPHYHVLFFFNTDVPSSKILELVRESWKFGIVDASFVAD